jgi:hypothetical protein
MPSDDEGLLATAASAADDDDDDEGEHREELVLSWLESLILTELKAARAEGRISLKVGRSANCALLGV